MHHPDWGDYGKAARERILALPDEWFRVPYRSRDEALTAVFGTGWQVTDVPVHADFVIPGVLLTHPGDGARVMTAFFADRWYPAANAPENRPAGWPEGRPVVARGRAESYRAALKDMVGTSVWAPDLALLVRTYGLRAEANPQARAYPPALFGVWLTEQGITGADADGLRTLAGLGGVPTMLQIMAEYGPPR